ncbi:MAG: hypothetical protein JWN08_299 [Frankiales bacterium]|nr:hypothetical protein [Frankiales bacterium]
MTRRPLRIGNYSGYLGDRPTALAEVLAGDPLDVIFGDHLAEVTLAALTSARRRDPGSAWVPCAVELLRPQLRALVERGTRLVTDAGGFSPAGLAAALRQAAREDGVPLSVAHVEGDDVLDRWRELCHLEDGTPLEQPPLAANAYLGGWGIDAALEAGADVVVCGRVTDASMVVGPAAWWHAWERDDLERLAGAVVAGHLLECGPHVTGGNFSGFTALGDLTLPGFRSGELADDGSVVVTKHAGSGGAVTVDTDGAAAVRGAEPGPPQPRRDGGAVGRPARAGGPGPGAGLGRRGPARATDHEGGGLARHRVVGTVFPDRAGAGGEVRARAGAGPA